MKIINASFIAETTMSLSVLGVVYVENLNEFWRFNITLNKEETDIIKSSLLSYQIFAAFIESLLSIGSLVERLGDNEIRILLESEEVRKIAKSYIRGDKLNNLE